MSFVFDVPAGICHGLREFIKFQDLVRRESGFFSTFSDLYGPLPVVKKNVVATIGCIGSEVLMKLVCPVSQFNHAGSDQDPDTVKLSESFHRCL